MWRYFKQLQCEVATLFLIVVGLIVFASTATSQNCYQKLLSISIILFPCLTWIEIIEGELRYGRIKLALCWTLPQLFCSRDICNLQFPIMKDFSFRHMTRQSTDNSCRQYNSLSSKWLLVLCLSLTVSLCYLVVHSHLSC